MFQMRCEWFKCIGLESSANQNGEKFLAFVSNTAFLWKVFSGPPGPKGPFRPEGPFGPESGPKQGLE